MVGATFAKRTRKAALAWPGHRPLNSGLRFCRNAPMPSRASSEPNAFAKAAFSASIPSSRSPACETCLICSSATGAWPANLRAQRQRRVEQLVVGDQAG